MNKIDEYLEMIKKTKGVILDANVALLYVVGSIDPKLVHQHERTREFQPIDFFTLLAIVQKAKAAFSIPHTLTEVSNLVGKTTRFRDMFRLAFRNTEELGIKSLTGFGSRVFSDAGLTDAMLFELAQEDYLVVTADHALYSFITNFGKPCINFTYLKERE